MQLIFRKTRWSISEAMQVLPRRRIKWRPNPKTISKLVKVISQSPSKTVIATKNTRSMTPMRRSNLWGNSNGKMTVIPIFFTRINNSAMQIQTQMIVGWR